MELGHGELAGTHEAGIWGASWDTWNLDIWSLPGPMELGYRELAGTYELGHWDLAGHMELGNGKLARTHGALIWGASWDTWSLDTES